MASRQFPDLQNSVFDLKSATEPSKFNSLEIGVKLRSLARNLLD